VIGLLFWCGALLAAGPAGPPAATELEQLFEKANSTYQEARKAESQRRASDALRLYAESIRLYNGLREHGCEGPEVYYNLGNAYFRTGDVARAILWYRRAERLLPRDRDLVSNLDLARRKAGVEPEELPELFQTLLFFYFYLSFGEQLLVLGVFYWIASLSLAAGLFTRHRAAWHTLKVSCALGLVMLGAAGVKYYRERLVSRAVVLEPCELRKGRSRYDTVVASLPVGTELTVEETLSETWVRVKGESEGWVRETELATGVLRLRKDPSPDSEPVATASVPVQQLERRELVWYKVTFKRQTGWIDGRRAERI